MRRFGHFSAGLKDGIPIFLGYLAVSFTFGIAAVSAGLTIFQSVLISATNLTSAGQFAALSIISASSGFIEMALSQLVINLRYSLMSSSLSQKFSADTPFIHRFFVAFGNTDEVFGVSSSKPGKISPYYSYGLISISWLGWTLGTLLGAVSGSLLPANILSALGVALYGMFIAIIIPPARTNKVIAGIIIISMILSTVFSVTPYLKEIPSGFKIIILTVIIALAAAFIFPVKDEEEEKEAEE